MSALLLSILSVVAQAEAPAAPAEKAEGRKFFEISQDVRAVIRAESQAETKAEKAEAIHKMADLYLEIKRDPRLALSDTLKSQKAKLWSRLTSIKKKLVREFDLPRRAEPKTVRRVRVKKKTPVDELATEISESLADQLNLVGGSLGGPGQAYSASSGNGGAGGGLAARGGAGRFDYGPDLVALIERVIHPEFWDTNGGPGSIFYYRPLHALVVSATSEIHHSLGGTLDTLRKTMF